MGWGPYRGRIPYVDEENIVSYGRDDIRGLPIMVDDMVPVMQYAGSQIIWTGFYTHKDFVDIPQPQLSPPWLPADPQPSPIIRILARQNTPPIPTGLTLISTTDTTITVEWNSVQDLDSYQLQYTSPVSQITITDIPTTTNPTVTYTITDLAPNTLYYVQVASVVLTVTKPVNLPPYTQPSASAYSDAITATTL